MPNPNAELKLALGAVLCAAFITGCGNGNNNAANDSTDIGASATALVAYMNDLIGRDGNSDAVDVNAVTLVQDDTSEPSAVTF